MSLQRNKVIFLIGVFILSQNVSTAVLPALGAGYFFVVGGSLVHWGMFYSLGLCLQVTVMPLPPFLQPKICIDVARCLLCSPAPLEPLS